ncbi:cell wall hydrolase [Sphingomonas sp. AOB5]|uniref:cell wall hydrolase n=1 Tax=Sphingomonas sp. AOB5 TaxID=3034017 RepID=UPI0023F73853|nr:cell wall hydrolase [Sphingomonas sp. AOB5]MDF7774190.1 cell wall hydrolase [Sphingomonas sp. AOB5]
MANANTLEMSDVLPIMEAQDVNSQEHHVVPMPPAPAVALAQTGKKPGEIVQPIPAAESETAEFTSLSAAVAAQDHPEDADRELHCLAVGVYYEAKGEPLAGQLAVAEVILNRAESGRFARSVCGVLTQRGQFSFVRGGVIPTPPENAQWRRAMAVAQVAQKDLWDSPVDDALYFHARYVSPGWKRPRVGIVGNHVFYR